jgi:hypothetical protein
MVGMRWLARGRWGKLEHAQPWFTARHKSASLFPLFSQNLESGTKQRIGTKVEE